MNENLIKIETGRYLIKPTGADSSVCAHTTCSPLTRVPLSVCGLVEETGSAPHLHLVIWQTWTMSTQGCRKISDPPSPFSVLLRYSLILHL